MTQIEITTLGDGVTCVRLAGRLDAPGADAIGLRFTAATAAAGRPVAVDLGEVEFVSSMGLRLLLSAARALDAKGARLVVFNARGLVAEALDHAAIDSIVPVCADEAQAMAALAADRDGLD